MAGILIKQNFAKPSEIDFFDWPGFYNPAKDHLRRECLALLPKAYLFSGQSIP
jgi:hypothetical protein